MSEMPVHFAQGHIKNNFVHYIWDFPPQLPNGVFHLISAKPTSLFSSEFEQNRARNRACPVPTMSAYNKVAACATHLGNQSNSHRSCTEALKERSTKTKSHQTIPMTHQGVVPAAELGGVVVWPLPITCEDCHLVPGVSVFSAEMCRMTI
jgi:hypothetical protein